MNGALKSVIDRVVACDQGARDGQERVDDLVAMIEELVWAMHVWGADEDNSIPPEAYASFREALTVARIPVMITIEDGEPRYLFDPEWAQRQRVTWAMRQQQAS